MDGPRGLVSRRYEEVEAHAGVAYSYSCEPGQDDGSGSSGAHSRAASRRGGFLAALEQICGASGARSVNRHHHHGATGYSVLDSV